MNLTSLVCVIMGATSCAVIPIKAFVHPFSFVVPSTSTRGPTRITTTDIPRHDALSPHTTLSAGSENDGPLRTSFSSSSADQQQQNNDEMFTLYEEWRTKYGRGDFDPHRFRTFTLYVVQSQRALELERYRSSQERQATTKGTTTGSSSWPISPTTTTKKVQQRNKSSSSSLLPAFLEFNAYADCTPEEYRTIKRLEAQGQLEPRQLVNEQAQQQLESKQNEEESLNSEILKTNKATTYAASVLNTSNRQRALSVNGRGPDGEDGDAISSFMGNGKSRTRSQGPATDPDTTTIATTIHPAKKPRSIPVDYRGPGEDGAASASFVKLLSTPPQPVSSSPQLQKQLQDLEKVATEMIRKKESNSRVDTAEDESKLESSVESISEKDATETQPIISSKKKQTSVNPMDGQVRLPLDDVDPSGSVFSGMSNANDTHESMRPVESMAKTTAIMSQSPDTSRRGPNKKESLDPSLTSRLSVSVRPDNRTGELVQRRATIFPKRTEAHEKSLAQPPPTTSPSGRPGLVFATVKPDIFARTKSATTFPKRDQVLAKIKARTVNNLDLKPIENTNNSSSPTGSSFVKPDVFFPEKSATQFPKRTKANQPRQDAAKDIKPDASLISDRDATQFPKRGDNHVALIRAAQFRDPPKEPKKILLADQKQMNLGAPFSFAKQGQAEDLPPPDAEEMLVGASTLHHDSTIEVSETSYEIKDAEDKVETKQTGGKRLRSTSQAISKLSADNDEASKLDTNPETDKEPDFALETVTQLKSPSVDTAATVKLKVEPPSSPMPDGPVSAEQYRAAAEARLRLWSESFKAHEGGEQELKEMARQDNVMELESQLQQLREELEKVEAEALEQASVSKELFQRSLLKNRFQLKRAETASRELAAERNRKAREHEIQATKRSDFRQAAASSGSAVNLSGDTSTQKGRRIAETSIPRQTPVASSLSSNQASDLKRQRRKEIEDALKADFNAAAALSGRRDLIEGVFEGKIKVTTSRTTVPPDPFAVGSRSSTIENPHLPPSVDQVLQAEIRAANALRSTETRFSASQMTGEADQFTANSTAPTTVPSPLSIEQVLRAEMRAAKTLHLTETPDSAVRDDPLPVSSTATTAGPSPLSIEQVLRAEMEAAEALIGTPAAEQTVESLGKEIPLDPLVVVGSSSCDESYPLSMSVEPNVDTILIGAESLVSTEAAATAARGVLEWTSLEDVLKAEMEFATSGKALLEATTSTEVGDATTVMTTPASQISEKSEPTGEAKAKRKRRRKRQNRKGNRDSNRKDDGKMNEVRNKK